jgi:hypothetical protein
LDADVRRDVLRHLDERGVTLLKECEVRRLPTATDRCENGAELMLTLPVEGP